MPTDGKAIIREEGLALVRELDGDIHEAIAHRNREIALMERLHRESQSPQHNDSTRRYMLRDRDETALEHRGRSSSACWQQMSGAEEPYAVNEPERTLAV